MPAIPLPDPPLTDGRVLLRAWEDGDVPWLAREGADPDVVAFAAVGEGGSEAEVLASLLTHGPLRRRGEELHLLAAEVATGERVGPLGLHGVDLGAGRAEVGYWTAAGARGRGATSAALRLLCGWAFRELGLARLELRTVPENVASVHVAEACGFARDALLPGAHAGPGGTRRDLVRHVLRPGALRGAGGALT